MRRSERLAAASQPELRIVRRATADEFQGEGQMFPRILILSGEPEHRHKLSEVMSSCGLVPVRCETISAAKGLVMEDQIEVIVCDDVLPDGDFRELIRELKLSACEARVVVMSRSYDDWGDYLEAMIAGAYDYLAYLPYPGELEQAVAAALVESRARRTAPVLTAA
jgi:DNA-binding NtrC family response regulator